MKTLEELVGDIKSYQNRIGKIPLADCEIEVFKSLITEWAKQKRKKEWKRKEASR